MPKAGGPAYTTTSGEPIWGPGEGPGGAAVALTASGAASPAGAVRPGTESAGGSEALPAHAHGSTAGGMRGHRWGALRREWIKLLFQRRSYLIWGGAFLIPFLIALAFYLTRDNPEGGGGPVFMERVTSNGMFVTLASLTALIPFLLPMAAAMVAGYMIAGEAELGTLRIVLLRPTRRGSFVMAKWLMAIVYLAVGLAVMLAGGLLFGGIFFGLHPMVTLSGSTVGVWHGLGLIVLSCLYALAAMSCIVSMALLFSTMTDSSPDGAHRHHRHLHRDHGAHPVQLLRLAAPVGVPAVPDGLHELLPRSDLLASDLEGAGRLRAVERRADVRHVPGLPAQGRAVVG